MSWNLVRELRCEQAHLFNMGQRNLSWQKEREADIIESGLLKEEIRLLSGLYLEYMLDDNKTQLKYTGTIIRKKQIRLEKVIKGGY
ncbi:MAG: hypothetical protein ACRCR2_05110 [Fusobacteriaceae bacterium]